METGIFDRVVEVALQRCYLSGHQHTVWSGCAAAATHHRHKQGHAYHNVYVLWDWEASFYPHKSQKPITYNPVQSRDLAFFVFAVDSRVLTIIGLLGVCEKKKSFTCVWYLPHMVPLRSVTRCDPLIMSAHWSLTWKSECWGKGLCCSCLVCESTGGRVTDSGAVFNRGDYLALLVTPLLQPSVDLSVS